MASRAAKGFTWITKKLARNALHEIGGLPDENSGTAEANAGCVGGGTAKSAANPCATLECPTIHPSCCDGT
jgi:hypothetical protein